MIKPCKVTAELGTVHLGNMSRAKELIKLAKISGADCVKFQKRNPIECVPKYIQDEPHPNQIFSYGKTYLEHRIKLEFSIDQHKELEKYCNELDIAYAISVFDATSAKEVIEHLNPIFIKVPSACNNNQKLFDILFNTEFDIHISLGMSEKWEIEGIIEYLFHRSIPMKRWLLYHCTSEYPCPFEHLYLLEIKSLKDSMPDARIGFSNHGYGIAADIASYILGAEWIERHFVDDRTLKHSDAAASLEPSGLHRLCRDLLAVYWSLKTKSELSDNELAQRKKLRLE